MCVPRGGKYYPTHYRKAAASLELFSDVGVIHPLPALWWHPSKVGPVQAIVIFVGNRWSSQGAQREGGQSCLLWEIVLRATAELWLACAWDFVFFSDVKSILRPSRWVIFPHRVLIILGCLVSSAALSSSVCWTWILQISRQVELSLRLGDNSRLLWLFYYQSRGY